jgi:hypothetical protein
MIKNEIKFLFLIIVSIILYDSYIVYIHKKSENIKNSSHKKKKNTDTTNINYLELPEIILKNNNEVINIQENNENNINENNENNEIIDINLYGKPYDYVENKYIVWIVKPWNKIIYKYGEKYPFYFYIKIKIPSLNNFQDWKNIINNLNFNPQSGEIILPSKDEETALSIVNLMISNFKGDITFDEIINKNLIDISITKSKNSSEIKNKLIKLIIENNTVSETFKSDNNLQTRNDNLHDNIQQPINDKLQTNNDNFQPYDGSEYSYF